MICQLVCKACSNFAFHSFSLFMYPLSHVCPCSGDHKCFDSNPPHVEHGNFTYNFSLNPLVSEMIFEASLSCDENYILWGHALLFCDGSGQWDTLHSTCNPVGKFFFYSALRWTVHKALCEELVIRYGELYTKHCVKSQWYFTVNCAQSIVWRVSDTLRCTCSLR